MQNVMQALEWAETGSRELDAMIGRAIDAEPKLVNIWKPRCYPKLLLRVNEVWPAYTTSIDAALTLVPEGWSFRTDRAGMSNDWTYDVELYGDGFVIEADHRSFPVALCIASLKARDALRAQDKETTGG